MDLKVGQKREKSRENAANNKKSNGGDKRKIDNNGKDRMSTSLCLQ